MRENLGPCLCGDPECGRCFPGRWIRDRKGRKVAPEPQELPTQVPHHPHPDEKNEE